MGGRHSRDTTQSPFLGQAHSTIDSIHLPVHIRPDSIAFHPSTVNPSLLYLDLVYDATVECVITLYYWAEEVMDDGMNTKL